MDAREWDRRYAASELVWSAGPNQFVAAELADLPPGRALDVAAGEGRNAIWLATQGWRVTAVDFAQAGLDKGRALQEHHDKRLDIEWVCADVLTYEPDRSYDLVLLAYLQLPDEERHTAVRRSFDALAPGGTFFLIAHDSTNLTEGTGGPPDPSVLYTAEDVLADLDGERFEVVRAERVAREVAVPHEHPGEPPRTAYDALVHVIRTPTL